MIKLIKGNAYEEIKHIPDKSVDLIIIDPPYKIEGLHEGTGLFKNRQKNNGSYIDDMMKTDLGNGIDIAILDDFVRIQPLIYIYIWCNKEQIYDYLNYYKDKNCNFEIIIWAKTNIPPFTNEHYLKDKEYCLMFREKGTKLNGTYETMKTFYLTNINIKDRKQYDHPTIKDLGITKNLILNSTNEGDTVLDCFMGSGTTGVACKELNRNFIGIEIDNNYFKIAKDRINGITQIERKKLDEGQLQLEL